MIDKTVRTNVPVKSHSHASDSIALARMKNSIHKTGRTIKLAVSHFLHKSVGQISRTSLPLW